MQRIELKSVPLLNGLNPEDANGLARLAKIQVKMEGENIIMAGESVLGIYVILTGSVGVFSKDQKQQLAVLTMGDTFGEMATLAGSNASATLKPLEDNTTLLLIGKKLIQNLTIEKPELAAHLYRGIAQAVSTKLRRNNQKILDNVQKLSKVFSEAGEQQEALAKLEKAFGQSEESFAKVLNAGKVALTEETEQGLKSILTELQEMEQSQSQAHKALKRVTDIHEKTRGILREIIGRKDLD